MSADLEQDRPTLGSAIQEAAAELGGDSTSTESARHAGPPAEKPVAIEKPSWEPPGWSKRWKEPSRKALEALYQREDVRPHWEAIQSEFDETYQAYGRQGQEYGEFKRRVEPVWNILSKYEPQYRLQGMTLEQGVGQLVQAAEYLATNPDEALPWLAQTYAPRDAAAVIRALGQAWGVDLGQVTADQPYVDPAYQQMVAPLQQTVAQMQYQLQMREQQEMHRTRMQIVDQVAAFEDAKDASGNPLYPHFRRVFEPMIKAVRSGFANDLASAYQFAVRNDPELAKEIEAQQAEEARRKALEQAKARSDEAAEAARAARNPGGKGSRAPAPNRRGKTDLRQLIRESARELGS